MITLEGAAGSEAWSLSRPMQTTNANANFVKVHTTAAPIQATTISSEQYGITMGHASLHTTTAASWWAVCMLAVAGAAGNNTHLLPAHPCSTVHKQARA